MNTTSMRRRIAALGISVVAGVSLAATGGTPASASNGTDTANRTTNNGVVDVQASVRALTPFRQGRRWVRLGEFDSRRQCERAGERGERRGAWDRYRCVRDWDRDWRGGDWDRRGNDWDRGRRGWDRRGWDRDDYTLYVQRSWRR